MSNTEVDNIEEVAQVEPVELEVEVNQEDYAIKLEDPIDEEYPFKLKKIKARKKLKTIIADYSTNYLLNIDLSAANQSFVDRICKLGLKNPEVYHPFVRNDIVAYVDKHYPYLSKSIVAFCDKVQIIYAQGAMELTDDDVAAIVELKKKSEEDLEFETLEVDQKISANKIQKVESQLYIPGK